MRKRSALRTLGNPIVLPPTFCGNCPGGPSEKTLEKLATELPAIIMGGGGGGGSDTGGGRGEKRSNRISGTIKAIGGPNYFKKGYMQELVQEFGNQGGYGADFLFLAERPMKSEDHCQAPVKRKGFR